jgi:hypothetical protein
MPAFGEQGDGSVEVLGPLGEREALAAPADGVGDVARDGAVSFVVEGEAGDEVLVGGIFGDVGVGQRLMG